MDYKPIYSELVELFALLVQAQAGKQVPKERRWLYYAEPLAIKLFSHLVSMRQLADGARADLGNARASFVDHSSITLLARAAIETYLTFYFLFVAPQDEEESRFRFKVWELGGLLDRQRFHAMTKEGKEAKEREKLTVDVIRQELSASRLYKALPEKKQKMAFGGNWRDGKSWTDLAKVADFNEKYFRNIYGYLCGYAHSSFLSVLQVSQAQSLEVQKGLAHSMLGLGVVIMSHFAFSYSKVFKPAAEVLKRHHEKRQLAEKWRFGSEDMAKLYGE